MEGGPGREGQGVLLLDLPGAGLSGPVAPAQARIELGQKPCGHRLRLGLTPTVGFAGTRGKLTTHVHLPCGPCEGRARARGVWGWTRRGHA